jgi:hypothetical protein
MWNVSPVLAVIVFLTVFNGVRYLYLRRNPPTPISSEPHKTIQGKVDH